MQHLWQASRMIKHELLLIRSHATLARVIAMAVVLFPLILAACDGSGSGGGAGY